MDVLKCLLFVLLHTNDTNTRFTVMPLYVNRNFNQMQMKSANRNGKMWRTTAALEDGFVLFFFCVCLKLHSSWTGWGRWLRVGAGQSRGELSSAVPGDSAAESANFSETTGSWVCACSPRWSSAAWLTSKPWLDQGEACWTVGRSWGQLRKLFSWSSFGYPCWLHCWACHKGLLGHFA